MIHFVKGNIFDAHTDAIVNTVNLVGVMGKGIALQFKERFGDNYEQYRRACHDRTIDIGKSLVVGSRIDDRPVWIVNFPTKVHWRNPSEYRYIEAGLDNLRRIISDYGMKSIAIPPLGAGNGGLDWENVRILIETRLADVDCDVYVYEPGESARSMEKSVKLTPARALLVYMIGQLQDRGSDATAFAAVKAVYFMQKFGARGIFRMKFEPYIYGPYCDKVRHLLHAMDGTFVRGFSDMSKKPFEPFDVMHERIAEVTEMVMGNPKLKGIAEQTCRFLDGYSDDFSLELLSSVDYLMEKEPAASTQEIYKMLCAWNPRKSRIFSDPALTVMAYNHISAFSARLPL